MTFVEDYPNAEDLGNGVFIARMFIDGKLEGLAYCHPSTNGECRSYVPLRNRYQWEHGWDLLSEQPLTISPSLLCRTCGNHGFIRSGKWVPA